MSTSKHDAKREADLLVEDIADTKRKVHEEALAKLGVLGDAKTESIRTLFHRYNLSYYPLMALGLLYVADTYQSFAFTVLTPEISRALGVGIGAIAAARALHGLSVAVAPLPVAALVQRRAIRALMCILTGLAWSFITLFTGVVVNIVGLTFILCLDGLTTGSVTALHTPLIMDTYHPETRVRAVATYSAFGALGNVASPLVVGFLAGAFGLSWRGVFLVMGLMSLGMTFFALGLKDPGFGKWDTKQLRASVHRAHGESEDLATEEVSLGFWEICRRLLLIPTCRRIYGGFAVFGILTVPLGTFISFFLDRRWDFGPTQRGYFFAFYAGVGVLALLAYGSRGEKQFRQDPAKVVRTGGVAIAAGVIFIALGGLMPVLPAMLACFGMGGALIAVVAPALGVTLMSIIPAQMRPHAQALVGIFLAIGGMAGALLLSGIDRRYGVVGTMIACAIPGVAGSLIIASASRLVRRDLDRMIDEVLEDEEVRRLAASGVRLPMLACRGINFSYGQLQVLFSVDFTVDDGEMVALLGTNGAGKSTLLKVVSGIGLPWAGSVRFRGQEITYVDAERRLRIGITQIPGGRAVFGPMTVIENLRAFGYTMTSDRRGLENSIDTCLDAFPRLAERRNALASTLSGGEQQMLGLSKALMIKPRLLLIDELSLGLSPIIVGQLLEMVRRINSEGTAVVLVEQSVNIALNLVDHAYFMEKGEIRFDGPSKNLLERDDLLRAVFLKGAAAGAEL